MSYRCFLVAFLVLFCFSGVLCADVDIYFAPKGGFSPENNQRTIILKDGRQVPATLNSTLLDFIDRVDEGEEIKIAMYAFSYRPVQDALIDAAKNRKVKVKIILDAVASWTEELRADFKQRVLAESKLAKKEGRIFDFQLKEIYPKAFEDRERVKTLTDGTIIYGTMHEKFGIVIPKGKTFPLHSFCGSANISWSAGQVFAENRVYFKNEPAVGRVLAEEFSRLWNEFGTPITDNCQSEKYLPIGKPLGELKIISNSKPTNETEYQRIDRALIELMNKVEPKGGSIDVAMFSFTHVGLANRIISLASRYPDIKVRVLLDQTQIQDDEHHQGVLGPYIERSAHLKGLKNLEVRYKWRSNAYAWDEEEDLPMLIHWRNLLLHHKCMVVNRKLMGIGSFNWSTSAEFRNFENIMIFNGLIPEQQTVISRFMNEYDIIWNSLKPQGPISEKIPNPQVIEGPRGRELRRQIIDAYRDGDCKFIMTILDNNPAGCTRELIASLTKLEPQLLQAKLERLEKVTLIFHSEGKEEVIYRIAD